MQCSKCHYEPTMAELQRSAECCVKCGNSLEGSASAHAKSKGKSGAKPSFSWGWIAALLVICVLGYGGYEGYLRYERQQFIGDAEGYVRGTTIHLQQMLEAQRNPGAMTFKEFFDKSARSIEEIDGFVVRVSMLDGQQDIKDAAITYMKTSQDVLRGVSSNWRAILEFSSAGERIERARVRYAESSNEYVSKYAMESWDEALEDRKAAVVKVDEAKAAFNKSLARERAAVEALIWFATESKPAPGLLKDL